MRRGLTGRLQITGLVACFTAALSVREQWGRFFSVQYIETMSQIDAATDPAQDKKPHSVRTRLVAIAVAVVITAGIFLGWERFSQLGVIGYPAVFLGSLISNATLILPAPGFALVIAAGSTLNPFLLASSPAWGPLSGS